VKGGSKLMIAAALVVSALAGTAGCGDDEPAAAADAPGRPAIELIAPRNGSRHVGRAVVVRVEVDNFTVAPEHFGQDPELGEGHIRFSLNRVPDCVAEEKVERAENSPIGSGRLIGRSLDYPFYSGPNGVLAERTGTAGLYSPATSPEIFYQHLPPGFYRLIITLANNDGTPLGGGGHAVTNFEVLPEPDQDYPEPPPCEEGEISAGSFAERQ
jgi:hypothetical protein